MVKNLLIPLTNEEQQNIPRLLRENRIQVSAGLNYYNRVRSV